MESIIKGRFKVKWRENIGEDFLIISLYFEYKVLVEEVGVFSVLWVIVVIINLEYSLFFNSINKICY